MKRVWTPTPPIFGQNRFKHPMKVFVRESPASPSVPTPETCDTVSPLPELCPDGGVAGRMEKQLEAALSQYGDDLRGLVLVDQIFLDKEGALQTINRSCGMSHKPLKVEYGTEPNCGTVQCVIQIGSSFVQEGRGFSKETARQEAASRVLTALRQLCYTIEVKANVVAATEFGKTDIHSHSLGKKDSDHSLTENNVGNKLLRLMGWTDGKGLGKDGQGIQDPISASSEVVKRSRLGLGMSDSNESNFGTKVKTFLTRQMWQCDQFDLQFTPEFSPDERKIIHQIAGQLGLRSRSHGKGNNRFLVVSRKVELVQLVQELLTLGESAKYRVIPPGILNSQQSTDLLHNNNSSATS